MTGRLAAHLSGHVAALRVYEPLAAFEGSERARWEAYAAAGSAPDPAEAAALQREAALRALVSRTAVPVVPDHAYLAEVDGVTLVCPWRHRLRSLEALAEFLADVPDPLVDAWVPRTVADRVEDAVDELRLEQPRRPGILTSAWHVPLRWFVVVETSEREVRTSPQRCLLYRTPMSRARRRVARALAVLRGAVEDGVVTAGVEDLGRWLEEFHPRSMVELDYGGLVHLLDDAELTQDESARDIALALASLSEGDPERAAAAYGRVTARMKALQGVECAS